MAPVKKEKATATKKKPELKKSDDKVKRPTRGFHRFRSGMLNVAPKKGEKELVKANQGSPLLQLPPELRNRIWELVLGGNVLHSVWIPKKRGHRMIPPVSDPMCGMDLLRTCRQIYSETALLPYRENICHFWSVHAIKHHLRYLKPFQREQIRSLELRSIFPNGLGLPYGRSSNAPKAGLDYLPGLERVHVLIEAYDAPVGSRIQWDPEVRGKKVMEELEQLLLGRGTSITFEVEKKLRPEYYEQWDLPS